MRSLTTGPRSGVPWAPYVPDEASPGTCGGSSTCTAGPASPRPGSEIQRDLKDGPEACDRPAAGRASPDPAASPRSSPRSPTAWPTRRWPRRDPGRLKALVGLPHALRPGPAGRAADADVARPLRHQQPQGRRPGADAPAERDPPHALPRPRSASCCGAMLRDPALLVWLDAPSNRKGHPNENLARELMELFTLGIGHYTEDDVKEAARALTGWTVVGDEVRLDPRRGTTTARRPSSAGPARWTATTWSALLLDHPRRRDGWPGGSATSSWARGRSTSRAVEALAERPAGARPGHRLGRRDGPALAAVLRRRPTWAGASPSPVEFVVGTVRALELFDPPPSTLGAGRLVRRGWARTCSTRPTSAAGRAAGPGSRPARSSAGPTSPRPWSSGRARRPGLRRSTRSRWRARPWRRPSAIRSASSRELLLGSEPTAAGRAHAASSDGAGRPSPAGAWRSTRWPSPEAQLGLT